MNKLPEIMNNLLNLMRKNYDQFPTLKVKQVILGLVYSGLMLDNDQLGICQSMIGFYTFDCFSNKWRDLTSYKLPELIDFCESNRIIDRVVGVTAINAYSQQIFEEMEFELDFKGDILDKLNLNSSDKVGMVGKFSPMIPKIVSKVKELIIIEKDPTKLGILEGAKIISDPNILEDVNIAIITATTLLNHTIDDLLKLASSARIAVIGPTMGMLPDPFFKAGVEIVGGMKFLNPNKVIQVIGQGKGTMEFKKYAKKYIIEKKNYSGI